MTHPIETENELYSSLSAEARANGFTNWMPNSLHEFDDEPTHHSSLNGQRSNSSIAQLTRGVISEAGDDAFFVGSKERDGVVTQVKQSTTGADAPGTCPI